MSAQTLPATEAQEHFACFGGRCLVLVQGTGPAGSPAEAALRARRRLEHWHHQFSRFDPGSELSRLNSDPRDTVPVSAMMARFIDAALSAAAMTGGLVDPTLVGELERAGYGESFDLARAPAAHAIRPRPGRAAGRPNPAARWREVRLDRRHTAVTRPAGVRLDSGGIAKGLFGDVLAAILGGHRSFAIDAAGDVRAGGSGRLTRAVRVMSPFEDEVLHTFELICGAAATSGISKRSWLDRDGRLAHHLLDPATGRPAFTGIVQVTALAATGVEAEALSKAALLSGSANARSWLDRGGVIVYDDGGVEILEPPGPELVR
jgi:thiamine biosynthesis lipoprotein